MVAEWKLFFATMTNAWKAVLVDKIGLNFENEYLSANLAQKVDLIFHSSKLNPRILNFFLEYLIYM